MNNLIYLSSASHLFSTEELVDILNKSRSNNTRLNVTGLLLYNEGSILQILEGEQLVLRALFEKISMDDRHKGVLKIFDVTVTERSFEDWSMGFKQVSNEDWSELSGYLNLGNKEEFQRVANSGSTEIIAMIKGFANVSMSKMNV